MSQCDVSGAQQRSGDRDVDGLHQQLNGLTQPWLSVFSNGVNHFSSMQKLPEGLPVSKRENIFWSPQHQYDSGKDQPMSNVPELRDIFTPPDEMNSPCFDSSYEDHRIQNSNKPAYHEQHLSEDVNQLMLDFQSLMYPEHSAVGLDSVSNVHKQAAGMNCDDSVAEHWKTIVPAKRVPKQLAGGMKPSLWEHSGGVRKEASKHDAFQYVPDFSSENTNFHPQPKSGFAQTNFKKKPVHSESVHVNGYSEQHGQLSQMQSHSLMKKENQRMPPCGFGEESSPISARTHPPMRGGVNQPISQIPYLQGSLQLSEFEDENGMVPAGNIQPCPPMYPVDDPRNPPRMPFNYDYSALANGSGVSGFTPGDVMLAGEAGALNYYGRRGGNVYPFTASAMANSVLMNQGLVVQFPVHLDECYEQWRCLESERMRVEGFLMKTKRTKARSNANLSKMSSTSAAIDQLIVCQMREQTKVADLLDKIKCVYRLSLHVNIHTALSRHHAAVCVLQDRFQEGTAKLGKQQQLRPCFMESKDVALLDFALKKLAAATGRLRTALWCSLQMTTALPVETPDQQADGEDAPHCQGYSFNI